MISDSIEQEMGRWKLLDRVAAAPVTVGFGSPICDVVQAIAELSEN